MAFEFQQVIQRIRLVSPAGEIFKPANRVLCALDAIAAHAHHDAPEHGVCKAASTLGERGQGKSRRTFFRAIAEAVACELVWRVNPTARAGIKYQAQIYLLSRRLIEAAATGYQGELLLFQAPYEPPGKPGDPPEIKSLKALAQHASARLAKGLTRRLITKVKEKKTMKQSYPQECQFGTMEVHVPAPAPGLWDAQGFRATGVGVPPPPQGGGGAGTGGQGIQQKMIEGGGAPLENESDEAKQQRRDFFDWFGDVQVSIDFQPRLVKGVRAGQRGAPMWKSAGGDPATATGSARTAVDRVHEMESYLTITRRKKRLEGVMHAVGDHPILLVDDLSADQVTAITEYWSGPMQVIETSIGNHQALLRAHVVLAHKQRTDVQRALSARFGGDGGAISGVQPHRYPGSKNLKNGGSWCTRLVMVRGEAHGDAGAQIEALLAQHPQQTGSTPSGAQPAKHSVVAGAGVDPSRDAFIFAIKGLKAGIQPSIISAQISAKFNEGDKHSRGGDGGDGWACRTVEAAGVKVLGRSAGWLIKSMENQAA